MPVSTGDLFKNITTCRRLSLSNMLSVRKCPCSSLLMNLNPSFCPNMHSLSLASRSFLSPDESEFVSLTCTISLEEALSLGMPNLSLMNLNVLVVLLCFFELFLSYMHSLSSRSSIWECSISLY
ncbi:hypothetical protein AMTRI_Chr08g168600 [Amborella trichopoda]